MKEVVSRKGVACVPFYRDLYINLVRDIADRFGAPQKESRRDIEEILHRVQREGLSFLTKTLPRLGKELDRALAQGIPFAPLGLDKRRRSTIPKFFGWLFERVFDSSGLEKPDSEPLAVKALRELVYVVYKLEIPFTEVQANNVCQDFVVTDAALPTEIQLDDVLRHARNYVTNVFGSFDPYDIHPRHGPGAVSTGEKNHEKHVFRRLFTGIEQQYPFTEYFVWSLSHVVDRPDYLSGLKIEDTGTAKVVLVPKDSRGPRLISCEPLEYQWIQQGLGNAMRHHLERNRYTSRRVNFASQEVNRNLARLGSLTRKWVTLDMKEASDRVSLALVELLFADCPRLLACMKAARTPRTRLPNGDIVHMKKFAPMGSNLCFPVEAFVFHALAVGCLVNETYHKVRQCKPAYQWASYQSLLRRAARRVYVYGDDIICRDTDYRLLQEYFPKVGLKFNLDKCCTQGSFRESCGLDAYKGVDVTPLRLKCVINRRPKQAASSYCSLVAFSNAAAERGNRRVAELVAQRVEQDLGPLPVFPDRGLVPNRETKQHYGVLAWTHLCSRAKPLLRVEKIRWNSDLQRREVRVFQAVPLKISVWADDWCMVLRRWKSASEHDEPGTFALTRRVSLKRVWTPLPL